MKSIILLLIISIIPGYLYSQVRILNNYPSMEPHDIYSGRTVKDNFIKLDEKIYFGLVSLDNPGVPFYISGKQKRYLQSKSFLVYRTDQTYSKTEINNKLASMSKGIAESEERIKEYILNSLDKLDLSKEVRDEISIYLIEELSEIFYKELELKIRIQEESIRHDMVNYLLNNSEFISSLKKELDD